MMCQSRPEIDLQEAISMYEFNLVPRSLFAADGTMLHCLTKSALMSLIEKEAPAATSSDAPTGVPVVRNKVVVVDGMQELLRSSQEEADTKMILHADDAAANGATEINICSLDTDVFILSLRR